MYSLDRAEIRKDIRIVIRWYL